jgi:hypothetical protein
MCLTILRGGKDKEVIRDSIFNILVAGRDTVRALLFYNMNLRDDF